MNLVNAIRLLQRSANHLQGDGFSIRVHYWGGMYSHRDTPLHKHSFFEICYVVDGQGKYFENGLDYPLEKGTFFCSRPGQLHKIYEGKKLYLVWAAFELEEESEDPYKVLFQKLAKTEHFYKHNAEKEPAVLLWRSLIEHADQSYPPSVLAPLSVGLLLSLQKLFCGVDLHGEQLSHTPGTDMLSRAKQFVKDNLAQPLLLKEVARFLHISSRHLSRLFSDIEGIPYTYFVRQERIRAAAEKIRSTNQSLQSISEECGFSSVHYFTRVFLQETSVTPGEYRRRNRA